MSERPISNLLTNLVVKPEILIRLNDFAYSESAMTPPAGASCANDSYERFLAPPGRRVKLGDIDPNYHGAEATPEAVQPEARVLLHKLNELQQLMYAEKRHSLLIVLQGLDASGKDGVIHSLLTAVHPSGCRLVSFKEPKREELAHDFLWRVHPHLPAKGEVSIFNRSHYEDVLIVRVHQMVHTYRWAARYDLINDFERMLASENNTTTLKFLLYISKEEQLARFRQRLEDPARQWKISEADYNERQYWDRYIEAFEEMLYRTSTPHAPWFVIPSNCKWFRDLAVTQIVTQKLSELKMKWPKPTVNLDEIRRRYHGAEAQIRGV